MSSHYCETCAAQRVFNKPTVNHVQIVNGLGATNGFPDIPNSVDPAQTTTNGLGNLIVGYNEERVLRPGCVQNPARFHCQDLRTGSHNIVDGALNNYTSFGGLVVGNLNTISGPYSSVSGGRNNRASGLSSSVSGGTSHTASGGGSSVSGGGGLLDGQGNTAEGDFSTVSGGRDVTATGEGGHAP